MSASGLSRWSSLNAISVGSCSRPVALTRVRVWQPVGEFVGALGFDPPRFRLGAQFLDVGPAGDRDRPGVGGRAGILSVIRTSAPACTRQRSHPRPPRPHRSAASPRYQPDASPPGTATAHSDRTGTPTTSARKASDRWSSRLAIPEFDAQPLPITHRSKTRAPPNAALHSTDPNHRMRIGDTQSTLHRWGRRALSSAPRHRTMLACCIYAVATPV